MERCKKHKGLSWREQCQRAVERRGQKLWTPDEIILLFELSETSTMREASEVLNRSYAAICNMCQRYEISFNKHRWTLEENQFLRRNLGLMTSADIASKLGRTTASVNGHIQYLGLFNTYQPKRPVIHSDEDVELCRALYDEGLTIYQISEKMEIPVMSVYDYVSFKTRCYIPDFY